MHLSYSALSCAASIIALSSLVAFDISESYFFIITKAAFSSGILANCRLTSEIILIAALPTAFIAKAENTNGSIPPTNKPAITVGFAILILSIPACCIKAENKASAVSAAEAIAKPFPIAAVVLPTASNLSVL